MDLQVIIIPVDKVGMTSLVHGNFHKFTSGMVKLQDYKYF